MARLSICARLLLALGGCSEAVAPELASSDASGPAASTGDAGVVAAPADAAADAAADPDSSTDAGLAVEAGTPADAAGATQADTGPTSSAPVRALVDPARWSMTSAAEDPFTDRPPDIVCAGSAAMAEVLGAEPAFSVDTGSCNYLSVVQPARSRVEAGESLKVRLWHFDLTAPEPAEAHAVVLVDGIPVLDTRVVIPGQGGLLVGRLSAPRAIDAGAPVHFHLHNHGANSWSLVEVSAGP